MRSFPTDKIRNVALVGHGGTGKTTLAEALLAAAGAVSRKGRVDEGTATTDFEPEEVKRHISIQTALACLEVDGHKVNLLDTPGYADFFTEVEIALSVADLAVFVVSAVDGVEVQTEAAWKLASRLGLPRMIFVNKLDRERADFDACIESLRDTFGAGIAPLHLPIGRESELSGVVDLLSDTAYIYQDGRSTKAPVPDDMAGREHQIHDNLVEGIVVADDALMERYLEGDTPSYAELEATLGHGVASATVFPVLAGSASHDIGVDLLAKLICEIGPSPADRPPVEVQAGDDSVAVACDPSGEPLAYVFKTMVDPYVGRISLFKVLSGVVRPDAILVNPRAKAEEKLHSPFSLVGKEQVVVPEVCAGDIAGVAKLQSTLTGDTLAPKGKPVTVADRIRYEPVYSIAIRPKSKGDEDKLMTALHRLEEEDPALRVRRDDETHQTILSGAGETHLQVACERLSRKFSVAVDVEEVAVAYRETITQPAEAEGKYKKQTGGHGQFGVANLRIAPLERGGGFQFHDEIVGGAIPRQFIPAVEKGVVEAMASGIAFGYPVVDVSVTCFDGKFHPVDSSEMSFKMAGALAFKEAAAKAGPVLLEPISRLEVRVPAQYQGDVMGDLNARRGRLLGTESGDDGEQVVIAEVPTAEIMRYAIDLRSITAGRGSFVARHDHYDVAPPNVAAKIPRKEVKES
jgi:elongation factor G